MKRFPLISLISLLLFACEKELQEEQTIANLNYENALVEIKPGDGFKSERPSLDGQASYQFSIESISNDKGELFDEVDGIAIDEDSGIISVLDGNEIQIGSYLLSINVSNDNNSQVFEDVYQIIVVPLEAPENLHYFEENLAIDYNEAFTSEIPEIDGLSPLKYQLINNDHEFVTIDSLNGKISISNAPKLSGRYDLDVRVENEDGEATFENVFTFYVEGQFAGHQNGFYVYDEATEYLSSVLDENIVEWDGFTAAQRDGLHYTYSFLPVGDYQLIEVKNYNLHKSFGGIISTETVVESYCDYDNYFAIDDLVEGGNEFNIEESGLYLVSYDESLSELFYYNIQSAGAIGSATAAGWAEEQELTATINSSEVHFRNMNLALREGEWKIRLNCSWNIDRRNDSGKPPSASNNGYIIPTNFGGANGDLTIGNLDGNLLVDASEEGVYEIELFLNAENRFELELIRIDDLPEIEFDPDENKWAITGAATAVGWPEDNDCGSEGYDIDFSYIGKNGDTHSWQLDEVQLSEGDFIFRANDCWNKTLNVENGSITGPAAGNFRESDHNFECLAASTYSIILSTNDNGESYLIEIDSN